MWRGIGQSTTTRSSSNKQRTNKYSTTHYSQWTNERTNEQTNKQTNKQTEKFKDLSPTQLTVSNSSQSSVDSVSLFISDLSQVLEPSLSQAVIVLDSVMECAVVWVQCMHVYLSTSPWHWFSGSVSHSVQYMQWSKTCKISDKTQSVINMNSEMSYVVQCASGAVFSEPDFKTSVIQSTYQCPSSASKDHGVNLKLNLSCCQW